MKILSIDTASNLCTVAVLENKKCIKEIIVNDARNHSEKIMPVIEQALSESKLTLQDINLIVCDKGPGSFTGIRIGVGTVLAFKDSLNIPCVEISSSGNPSQGCLPERHRRRISDPQIHGDRNAAASRKKWFYCAGKRKKRCPSETHHSYKESGSTPSEHPCTHKAVGNTAYDRYFRS